jgi:alkylation response protein AidB-like acyl-CoA dehydrogenase
MLRYAQRRATATTAAAAVARRAFAPGVLYGLNDQEKQIVEVAKKFAESTLEPHAAEWDAKGHFPVDALREAAALGFGGIYTSTDFGGSGMSRLEASLIYEQLSAADVSTTAYLTIHNMCCWMVDAFGSPALREELVPKLASMEYLASYCLTEPSAGSDAASLRTTAKKIPGEDAYEITGSKAFISGGGRSDIYVVMCRTGGPGAKGISCFAIDGKAEGVSFGRNERKLGWCTQPTCIVSFDKVKVPASRLVGVEGDGFKYAMKGLDGGRVNISACSLGSAQRCLDLATTYSTQRAQFNAPIANLQSVQFRLAEMAAKVQSSRLMIRQAAQAIDNADPNATAFCAMAKMVATEDCYNVVDSALQVHGGYGYLKDFPIERHLRDLRVHRILEGTNEVMRMIVGRAVLADAKK